MKRSKPFGMARLGTFALLAATLVGLSACGGADEEQMAQSGRKIVQSIITAEMTGMYRDCAWPSDAAANYSGAKPANGPNMHQAFASTKDYFTEALYLNAPDEEQRARKCVLKDCSKDNISFGGVECAWRIAVNAKNAPGKTPVLVSNNLEVDALFEMGPMDTFVPGKILLKDIPPLGNKSCVVVYRDGSCKTFKAEDLTIKAIMDDGKTPPLTEISQDGKPFRFLP